MISLEIHCGIDFDRTLHASALSVYIVGSVRWGRLIVEFEAFLAGSTLPLDMQGDGGS